MDKPNRQAIKFYIIHMPPEGPVVSPDPFPRIGRLIGFKLTLEAANRLVEAHPGSSALRIWADKQ